MAPGAACHHPSPCAVVAGLFTPPPPPHTPDQMLPGAGILSDPPLCLQHPTHAGSEQGLRGSSSRVSADSPEGREALSPAVVLERLQETDARLGNKVLCPGSGSVRMQGAASGGKSPPSLEVRKQRTDAQQGRPTVCLSRHLEEEKGQHPCPW